MSRWTAASDCAEDARREEDDGADKVKHAAHRDANHTKRQQQQPDDGIEHQSQERERPANDKKNAPKKEFDHRFMRLGRAGCFIYCYADAGR